MPAPKNNGDIDKLSKKLDYGGDLPARTSRVPEFTDSARQAPSPKGSDWSDIPIEETPKQSRTLSFLSHSKFFRRLLMFSVGFFFLAIGVAALVFFGGLNRVSSENIDITVKGLVAVPGGDEIVVDVVVENRNRVALLGAELVIEYPPGARNPDDPRVALQRERKSLGDIEAGGRADSSLRLVLFGERNEIKSLKLSVEYRAKGSNAVFSKDTSHEITISSAPLVVSVEYPKEIGAREEIKFEVTVTSNSQTVLQDVLLSVDYPFGFTLEDTSPQALASEHVWSFGDMKPKEKRAVSFSGRIDAPENEDRTFRFDVGPAKPDDPEALDLPIVSVAETVRIKQPFIGLDMRINDSRSPDYAASLGQKINVSIFWQNNLSVDLNDAVMEIELIGTIFDRKSVNVLGSGFYRSSDNTIVWNKSNTPEFRSVKPGDRGSVSFSFDILRSSSAVSGGKLSIDASMRGTRFATAGAPQNISSSISSSVQIASDTQLTPQAVYSTGPFKNTGPIPPQAEIETTYTIRLPITNTLNRISNVVVTGRLPEYVSWKSVISPAGTDIRYDASERKVIWNAGVIEAGNTPREAAFQIGLLPSLSQVGSAPVLVEGIELTATDSVTGKQIIIKRGNVNTRLSTDPQFVIGQENVVR